MKGKSLFSIEVLAYILKFVFTIFALFMLYIAVQDAIDICDVLFTKHSELYNYGQLKGDTKHQFLSFLYDHQYSIYGGNATRINDSVPFKTSIILYYLFSFIPHFMLFIICCIAVMFFHNLTEKNIFDNKNGKKLLFIAIILVAIPLLEIIGDQITLAVTTNAINSKIPNESNYLFPHVKFLGVNYTYIFSALFVCSFYFVLKHGQNQIEYICEQQKNSQKN